ncbi:MAG: 2,3-bisphosphoglycerate-independent phosphoglycerate mutase [Thermoplasmata archaeon]
MILIILDGLGDRPSIDLHGRTPLQAAYHPNMNYMASKGINGLMHPISVGIRSGSDTSHMSLLGYDPEKYYPGRGPFEALGVEMDIKPGDLAFRSNFATSVDGIVLDRRAGREFEGNQKLADAVSFDIGDYSFKVKAGVEHRAALVVSGPYLSDRVTDSDPHKEGLPVKEIEPLDENARKTSEILNEYLKRARKILRDNPVNLDRKKNGKLPGNELLIRSPGKVPDIPSFKEKYGFNGACAVGIPWLKGLCRLLGMHVENVEGATGTVGSNYLGKIRSAISLSEKYPFVLVNIKATDVAGHDGNPVQKRNVIEDSDAAFTGLRQISDKTVISITGDHSTPCTVKDHSGDPVPIVFFSDGVLHDGADMFDEYHSSSGSLRMTSNDVMNMLLELSDRAEKIGS